MRMLNTVDVLKDPLTAYDAWDELNSEYNIKNYFLNFAPNATYVIRLLGPFIKAQRLYKPSTAIQSVIPDQVFNRVLRRNRHAFEESLDLVSRFFNDSNTASLATSLDTTIIECKKGYIAAERLAGEHKSPADATMFEGSCRDFVMYLAKVFYRIGWQNVLLSNAYIKNDGGIYDNLNNDGAEGDLEYSYIPNIRVVALSKMACLSLFRSLNIIYGPYAQNARISGLYAHDISVSKSGRGYSTVFNMNITPTPKSLKPDEIQAIFKDKLLDMLTLMRECNEKSVGKYLYRSPSNYHMSDMWMSDLQKERDSLPNADDREGEHYEELDRQINALPAEAFENREHARNPIRSLEI